MNHTRYAPPPLSQETLCAMVITNYPTHKKSPSLIETLVRAYLDFWRLRKTFEERRIVAPGCILAVREAHLQCEGGLYLQDCVRYFGRFVSHAEMAWGGIQDVRGALDTLRAHDSVMHHPPSEAWRDMTHAYELKKSPFSVVN
jgi:hypothetical protein